MERKCLLNNCFTYVTLWDPDFTKFQQELESVHLDWRTNIHWNVVPTTFQLNLICQGCWKIVGLTFNVSLFSNQREKVLILVESRGQMCPIVFLLLRTFSPRLENNNTLKCWFDNFPTTLTYVVKLENYLKNISMYGCFSSNYNSNFWWKFNEALN